VDNFFLFFGNWIYAVSIIHPTSLSLALQNHPSDNIEPFELVQKVHHLGILWSRAWALKAISQNSTLSETDRKKYKSSYFNHISKGLFHHNKIQKEQKFQDYSSYHAYDHWVPQFILYSLTDGF